MSFTRARFLYDDYAGLAAATITASTTATGFAAENMKTNMLGVAHRTTGTLATTYQVDLGSAKTCQCMALAGVNFTNGATASIDHSSDGAAWTAYVASGSMIKGEKCFAGVGAASISRRYWRMVVDNSGHADGYLSVGRMMVGPIFEPTDCFEAGYARNEDDLSVRQEAMNGAESFIVRPNRHGVSLRFPISTVSQLTLWWFMRDAIGVTKPFVAIIDPDNTPYHDTLFARAAGPIQLPRIFLPEVCEAIINVREVI